METLEELQEKLLQEQDAVKKFKLEIDDLKSKNAELTEANTKLMEHNNKLFMRVTSEAEAEQEPQKEMTFEEAEQAEIDKIRKLMRGE